MVKASNIHYKKSKSAFESIMPVIPLWIRCLNLLGSWFERTGLFKNILSVDSILKEAKLKTGLHDDGNQDILTPLQMLTQPETDGLRITFCGKYSLRRTLVKILVNRLRIQDEIKLHPEILKEKILRPIFIAGMPRTGSTLLQRLLSQDPHCRPLLCWEAFYPAPSPDPKTYEMDPRIRRVQKELRCLFKILPELARMHYMDARTPEECEWLLANSFMVPGFVFELPAFPLFNAWCQEQDKAEAYRYYKRQLQILQKNFTPSHWILKANEHVNSLDALISTFPDACVIQTHRDPLKSIPSNLNLVFKLLGLKYAPTENFLVNSSRLIIKDYAQKLERSITIRSQADPKQFFDVQYNSLLKDPIRIIHQIYDHFEYHFDEEFRKRILKWLNENPQGKYGTHHYSLEKFGLESEYITNLFSRYCAHFQVKPELKT